MEATDPQPTERTHPIKALEKSDGVVTTSDLMNQHFDMLHFNGQWADFMESPAKNMRVAIWGKPKNGKTVGAGKFARYLSNFGSVLYNFADQGFNASTQKILDITGMANKDNIHLTDTVDLNELEKLVATGNYDFVIVDMINNYIDRFKLKPFQFQDQFLKKYPDTSFLFIFETTKEGNFKGDQAWTHIVDQLVSVEDYYMETKGRYGVGEYDVWPEKRSGE